MQVGWDAGDLSMFDTAVRAEIALGRDDVDAGLRLWRAAAAALRDPRRQGPGGDLSGLEPWALQIQAIAVVAHAQHGRLALVAEITDALPASLAALTADPGLPAEAPADSYPGLSAWGFLLLALAMTDIGRAQQATAASALPPDGVPVSRPRSVSMTGVNGWCTANQRTDPDIWPGGTNALLMNGSS